MAVAVSSAAGGGAAAVPPPPLSGAGAWAPLLSWRGAWALLFAVTRTGSNEKKTITAHGQTRLTLVITSNHIFSVDKWSNFLTFSALCCVIWSYEISRWKTMSLKSKTYILYNKLTSINVTRVLKALTSSSSSSPLSLSLLVSSGAPGSLSPASRPRFSDQNKKVVTLEVTPIVLNLKTVYDPYFI